MHWKHDVWPRLIITGKLIRMLHLLKNTKFSTALHHASDIMKNVKAIFETSDTPLLDAWGKIMSDRSTLNGSGEENLV